MNNKDEVVYGVMLEIFSHDKRRKILKLMRDNQPVTKKYIAEQISLCKMEGFPADHVKGAQKIYETFGKDLSEEFIFTTWQKNYRSPWRKKTNYNKMPKPDGRDNKDILVGSGGSNRNRVRWPKQVRNKSTWKKFWKLFPRYEGFKSEKEWRAHMMELNRLEGLKIKESENE